MVHQKVDKFIFVFGSGYGAFGIWNGVLDINPNPRIRLSVRVRPSVSQKKPRANTLSKG